MSKKMKKAKVRSKKKAKKMKKVMRTPVKKAKKLKKAKAKKVAKKIVKAKAKKTVTKKVAAKKSQVRAAAEKVIGKVTHYYDRIGVAVIAVESPIRVGDTIRLKHGESMFDQKVQSLQVNHTPIAMANAGQEVGMKVDQMATEGTLLLKA